MKNILFLLITVLSLSFFTSCDKSNNVDEDLPLIEQIANSSEKASIEPSELPQNVLNYVEEEYFETYIETAAVVRDRGYEVVLGNENSLYFTMSGRELNVRQRFILANRFRICGGPGTKVEVEDLPASITEYITANYPDALPRIAKLTDEGNYFVAITGPALLVFDSDGNFVKETDCYHNCRQLGSGGDISDLPAEVTDYILDNYPDAQIKRVKLTDDGNYLVAITPHTILLFDGDGAFVEEFPIFFHRGCHLHRIRIADLPAGVVAYILNNYEGAEIKRAAQRGQNGGYVVGIIVDGERKILVFNSNGEFLFERP